MSSKLKLTGLGGGDTIIQGNDSITTDQAFTFPDNGGEIITTAAIPDGGTSLVGYQQGTWTPTTSLGAAEVIASANWERIGNQVKIQGQLSSFNNSAASPIAVSGWPYEPSAESVGSVMCSKFDNAANTSFIGTGPGATVSFFKNSTSKGAAWRQMQYVDRLDANSAVWFSITYRTSDTTWTPSNGATVT